MLMANCHFGGIQECTYGIRQQSIINSLRDVCRVGLFQGQLGGFYLHLLGWGEGPHCSQQLAHNERCCFHASSTRKPPDFWLEVRLAQRWGPAGVQIQRRAEPGAPGSPDTSSLLYGLIVTPGHGGLECQGQGPQRVDQTPPRVKQLFKCRQEKETVVLSDHGLPAARFPKPWAGLASACPLWNVWAAAGAHSK